jgi:hypothetical protein
VDEATQRDLSDMAARGLGDEQCVRLVWNICMSSTEVKGEVGRNWLDDEHKSNFRSLELSKNRFRVRGAGFWVRMRFLVQVLGSTPEPRTLEPRTLNRKRTAEPSTLNPEPLPLYALTRI